MKYIEFEVLKHQYININTLYISTLRLKLVEEIHINIPQNYQSVE
jgi:hypothetical protein